MTDRAERALAMLAPAARPVDHAFVRRVTMAMREERRHRAVRARLVEVVLRQLLVVAALAGVAVMLANIPAVATAFAVAPTVAWAGLAAAALALLLPGGTRRVPN